MGDKGHKVIRQFFQCSLSRWFWLHHWSEFSLCQYHGDCHMSLDKSPTSMIPLYLLWMVNSSKGGFFTIPNRNRSISNSGLIMLKTLVVLITFHLERVNYMWCLSVPSLLPTRNISCSSIMGKTGHNDLEAVWWWIVVLFPTMCIMSASSNSCMLGKQGMQLRLILWRKNMPNAYKFGKIWEEPWTHGHESLI